MGYSNIKEAKNIYSNGKNVTEFLRAEINSDINTSQIIEIAYDLQAGDYVEYLKFNLEKVIPYADELASLIAPFSSSDKSLLDVGTGDLTILNLILAKKEINWSNVYAFDISWSRLYQGLNFWKEKDSRNDIALFPFVADIKQIPIASNSIDIIMSSHALEPNGGSLSCLLKELFRICKDRLVLFEPSYELNSEDGKARMDKLGYIKDIEGAVRNLGGFLHDVIPIDNPIMPLNPSACYIIEPPIKISENIDFLKYSDVFTVPGTDFGLVEKEGFWMSPDTGLAFPVLKEIPILNANSGILATSLLYESS